MPDLDWHYAFFLNKLYVHPGSRMRSDMWRGYIGTAELFTAYKTANHSLFSKNPATGVHTNTIEGNWAAVKAQTPVRSSTRSLAWLYLLRFMLKREYPDTVRPKTAPNLGINFL
ncbi:hypothetical protein PAPHI01_2793 [Pancytospora philotis]|nr:hypothetical protein PAPHI01_2793 [Pancytospora philotis]